MAFMITMIFALAAGNALRIMLLIPPSSIRWVVLRSAASSFTGWNDVSAKTVYDGNDSSTVLDISELDNGTVYYYCLFSTTDGITWAASSIVSATPEAAYQDASTDVQELVRSRLEVGLANELLAGKIKKKDGLIQVLDAPPVYENTTFPVVSVHMDNETPINRAIGEIVGGEYVTPDGQVFDGEGWHVRVTLSITAWLLNGDERGEFRRALRRLIIANLPVFDDAGMMEIEFSAQDTEDFETFEYPVYMNICTLTCVAPVNVVREVPAISAVTVN